MLSRKVARRFSFLLAVLAMTVALPATIYAANVAEAKVFLKGSVNAEVSDFINAFASTQAGTKTESIVLMSNPAAAATSGGPMLVHGFHFVMPEKLGPGTYHVKGYLYRHSSTNKAKVAVSYICEAITNAKKYPGCVGFIGHAKGTFTLTQTGSKLSGRFDFHIDNGAGARHEHLKGSFSNLPVR